MSDEVKKKLKELQERDIDINEIILNALAQREAEIAHAIDQKAVSRRMNGAAVT